ncbi:MAG: exodeoxyribonuclease VII large subunit [Acidimicrobiales bacterium]|nr:exodeoxyribonuclease VII large subunit [Acidimicrobiales bacterium]
MDGRTFSVVEVTSMIQQAMRMCFPDEVWVEGEIRGLSSVSAERRGEPGSRHVFFQLVPPGTVGAPTACLPVKLFDARRRQVNALLRRHGSIKMADGVRIRVKGRLSFYEPRGTIELRMSGIDPTFTLGLLASERERVLSMLAEEGLLDRNATLAFPEAPRRLGLVTSIGSAAMADFLHELDHSGLGWTVVAVDARVQGLGAERSIVAALEQAVAHRVEVVAVVRGGGARTDLAVFDTEAVARAIASCPVPVVTGIGHEIDSTVADAVAHRSFKTPTACAAGLVTIARSQVDRAEAAWASIVARARRHREVADHYLVSCARQVAAASRRVATRSLTLLDRDVGRVAGAARHQLAAAERRLEVAEAKADGRDPQRVLARGWSLTRTKAGRVVRRSKDVRVGDEIISVLVDGEICSIVTEVDSWTGSRCP